MDMRQKLYPIFLKEAAQNLTLLQQFLQSGCSSCQPGSLEAAFRAAHTLKGTARLVEADAIHRLGRRLEALLEKHYSASSRPTAVEYEAMQLAVDWLDQLLAAFRDKQPVPDGMLNEALTALELAERFPGKTPLVELLDSIVQNRPPQLDDPFGDDPDLPLDAESLLRQAQDPFKDDPEFGLEYDCLVSKDVEISAGEENRVNQVQESDLQSGPAQESSFLQNLAKSIPAEVPFDPFADDALFETDIAGAPVESASANPSTESGSSEHSSAPVMAGSTDPFAEDAAFDPLGNEDNASTTDIPTSGQNDTDAELPVVETESSPGEQNPVAEISSSGADEAKRILDSLLLHRDDDQSRREYLCCAFKIGAKSYYLPIRYMVEIAEKPQLLPLPLAPPVVKGLVNLRGQVIPVVDLSVLETQSSSALEAQRLVVAQYQGDKLAFLADGIPALETDYVGEKIDLPDFIARYRMKGTVE